MLGLNLIHAIILLTWVYVPLLATSTSSPSLKSYMPGTKRQNIAGIILFMCPTNERRRYSVTSSLIGWAHKQNDPCRQNYLLQNIYVYIDSNVIGPADQKPMLNQHIKWRLFCNILLLFNTIIVNA